MKVKIYALDNDKAKELYTNNVAAYDFYHNQGPCDVVLNPYAILKVNEDITIDLGGKLYTVRQQDFERISIW